MCSHRSQERRKASAKDLLDSTGLNIHQAFGINDGKNRALDLLGD